ncbi:MAG: recombinase zinc beta ribbon domain-containing protein, partial [Bacteroidetes bacterium]|nr:recombinase zinc beta ribbon domain-containing protein [Bacteroidota bacterium]
ELVRHLFEMYASGEHSIDQIHDESKRINFKYLISGRFISRSECERMLKKVFYTGKFNWNGNLYQGDHPAIIDPMLFEQAQNVFSDRSVGSFSKKKFTFGRMIKCGECGNSITAEIKKGKYVYYHCTGYGNKHRKVYIPESKIDSMFADIVNNVTLPRDFYSFLSNCLEKEFGNRKIKLSQEKDRLLVSRDKIESDKKKSFQSMLDGHIDSDFFRTVTHDYQEQLDSIDYRLTNLSHSVGNDFDVAKKAIELSYQAKSLYLRANPDQKRRLLNSLLSNCHLTGVTLYPTYKKAFSIFAKGIKSGNKLGDRDSESIDV